MGRRDNLKIVNRKLTEIFPYENNPRQNDEAVNRVTESIKTFGFVNPILVDEDGIILSGHTRHKAANQLSLDEAPVIVIGHLGDGEKKAFRIMDNKAHEFSEWEESLLTMEMRMMKQLGYDLSALGFSDSELEKFLQELGEPDLVSDDAALDYEAGKMTCERSFVFSKRQYEIVHKVIGEIKDKQVGEIIDISNTDEDGNALFVAIIEGFRLLESR